MRVLVVAPHPDDEVIGCGGSVIRHVRKGDRVTIAWVTSGDSGGSGVSKETIAKTREKESCQAAQVLGVKDLVFLRLPDGYVSVDRESLITSVNMIRTIRPDTVYLPHRADGHRDHRAAHALFMEAVGRAATPLFPECEGKPWRVGTILGYEVWTPLQTVSFTRDITREMPRKLSALRRHRSQMKLVRYDEAVKGLNRYRGAMTGLGAYCECFEVLSLTG